MAERTAPAASPTAPQTSPKKEKGTQAAKGSSIFSVLGEYKLFLFGLIICAVIFNGLNLVLPKIIAKAIDTFTSGNHNITWILWEFAIVSIIVLIFTYLQNLIQTFASERVARDYRRKLSAKISMQSYRTIQEMSGGSLLTNLTSDVDAIKTFVSQAGITILSSVFLIIGASIFLMLINWKLALAVLTIVPVIAGSFFYIFSNIRPLFKKRQEVIDWLNKVINESILGSALIRVLNSQAPEAKKFVDANSNAQSVGITIVNLFASLIPVITIVSNFALVAVLVLGGHFVIAGTMSLGNFTAFTNYIAILIYPIIIGGFTSNAIASAAASYGRVNAVLEREELPETGTITSAIRGDIEVKNISFAIGERKILKDVSFKTPAGTRTAIIGPTAAGKTQLLYLMIGLTVPTSGSITYDNKPLAEYDKTALLKQIGFVFQDSIIFNLSVRENIAFSDIVKDEDIEKAIATAELRDFIDALPEGLNTVISERGTSLSGGQKQRIMLARALALNPKVLLLDDFTARVDNNTEGRILENIRVNYPGLTLISVTQKISSVEKYDQIVVLMEGEMIASGKHEELLTKSPEYVQIFNSQRSTNTYELQA